MANPPTSTPVQNVSSTSPFKDHTTSEEDEMAYDYSQFRDVAKPSGTLGSIAHIVKGAMGGGILGGHVAFKKAGYLAMPLTVFFGLYMGYCLYLLVYSAQILYRRTRIPTMTYPDVGEAAFACFPNPKVAKYSKCFRHVIDTIICVELFGACACYQLIIAKSLKQLVENSQSTSLEGINGYPHLRVYVAAMLIPIILICLITHLKWLAPFSIGANFVVLIALIVAIFYATQNNPNFENIKTHTTFYNTFEFCGMIVFSMSCAGIVIPIENNMKNPRKFPLVLTIALAIVIVGTVCVSYFGYVAYLEKSEAPITVNFPMEIGPRILKGLIAFMIYITHALNFWPPFNICFYYLRRYHKSKYLLWELLYRTLIVCVIAIVAMVFPAITAIMGFLGCFCLSNMAFIWPVIINSAVIWHRPGFGKYKWRLWRNGIMLGMGCLLLLCGGMVNGTTLVNVFIKTVTNK